MTYGADCHGNYRVISANFAFRSAMWQEANMLIEFRVANYRSIREEQCLSLVAANADKELVDCVIDPKLPGLRGTKLLRGAAIYGANASGKSNLVKAARFLGRFVSRSATRVEPGDLIEVEPFMLDDSSKNEPSAFEITFVAGGDRYVFGCSMNKQRVVEEHLVAYPNGAAQRWYQRKYTGNTEAPYDWETGASFRRDQSLEAKTRENSLFISVAAQFNHAQLLPISNWFRKNFRSLQLSMPGLGVEFTAEQMSKPGFREGVLSILRSADLGIVNATIDKRPFDVSKLKEGLSPALVERIEKGEISLPPEYDIRFQHSSGGGQAVDLAFESESDGTQRLFALAGPWLDILQNGYVVFIDEIESSLHPILIRELLKSLLCSKTNPKGAQVVFTTHSTGLLDSTILRRDQIWFTEKAPTGTTHLYPLTDFSPRKGEAWAKGYLAGRYGAIPFLSGGLVL